jgi:hypothetical protein
MVVLVAVGAAYAGENPDVRVFLTSDCDEIVDQIDVPSGAPFNYYLAADCLNTGLRAVAVTVTIDIPGFPAGTPTYLLPGTNAIGNPGEVGGWAMAWASCEYPDPLTDILCIVQVPYFATGAGTITLSAHPSDGQLTIDCEFAEDVYCIANNFGVGMEPPAGDDDCTCESPVEAGSWGQIKALYR